MKLFDIAYDDLSRAYGANAVDASVVFDAAHVYHHLQDNEQLDLMRVVLEAVPSINPPFDQMWFEIPTTKRRGAAMLIRTQPAESWGEIQRYADWAARYFGEDQSSILLHAELPVRTITSSIRCDVWTIATPRLGTRLIGSMFFALDKDGLPCGLEISDDGMLFSFATFSCGFNDEQLYASRRALVTWIFAMGLLHCKNVSVVDGDHPPEIVKKKQERKLGRPLVKFKTLEITVPKPRGENRQDKPIRESSDRMFHICRGHFAHYSDDKKLFGKYTGTFWRPAHVRGSAEAGTVFKDYRVKGAA